MRRHPIDAARYTGVAPDRFGRLRNPDREDVVRKIGRAALWTAAGAGLMLGAISVRDIAHTPTVPGATTWWVLSIASCGTADGGCVSQIDEYQSSAACQAGLVATIAKYAKKDHALGGYNDYRCDPWIGGVGGTSD